MRNPLYTVIIWQDVPSSACSELRLRFRKRNITVFWRSGHLSTHTVLRVWRSVAWEKSAIGLVSFGSD